MALREIFQRCLHRHTLFFSICNLSRLEQAVVGLVRDERVRQLAEILLQRAGDGVDVEVWVRDVVLPVLFEALLDDLDLAAAARFAVHALDVYATELDLVDAASYNGWDDAMFEFASFGEVRAKEDCLCVSWCSSSVLWFVPT